MHSDRIPESTKQWLQNEDFILWCLAPTQESEEWWVNYQKEHPEDQASLQEARKIILSARLNPVQRLPEESERLWARIEQAWSVVIRDIVLSYLPVMLPPVY